MKLAAIPARSPEWCRDVCLSIDDVGTGAESRLISEKCREQVFELLGVSYTRFWEIPRARFSAFKTQWEEETAFLSSTTDIAMHPAYQNIIGMGEEAIPFILAELKIKPGHWFWALKSITGEDPVPPEDRGRIKKMAEAWLRWGKERGYNI